MRYIVSALLAFFMGAIPFAYIVGRVTRGIDIRKYGSKNPGAGNVFHTISIKAGIVALLGDMGKGFFAVMIIYFLYHFPAWILACFAIVSVLGHIYSPFLKFKGGRGAATTLGSFLFVLFVEMHFWMFLLLFYLAIPWGLALIVTHSQVVSLAAMFPFFPLFLWLMTHNVNLTIVTIFLVIMLEIFGYRSLRREWPRAYRKYVKRFFKK